MAWIEESHAPSSLGGLSDYIYIYVCVFLLAARFDDGASVF